jgi:alkaline phosphatase
LFYFKRFTLGGYAFRGNPILGVVSGVYVNVSDLAVTLTSLLYGNGPGFYNLTGVRTVNLTNEQTSSDSYMQESAVPLSSETHGGEGWSAFLFFFRIRNLIGNQIIVNILFFL